MENNTILDRHILIVDDEEDLLKLLDISLRKEGFKHLYLAKNGEEAISYFNEQKIDMALLDISLPDIDGYDLCNYIRKISDIPILFLSARGDEMDRVIGLATGADDYISKPFSIKEVLLRIKIHLKRYRPEHSGQAKVEEEYRLSFGPFSVDKQKMLVWKDETPIELKAKEYKLFLFMIENNQQIISKERFCQAVWGEEYFGFDNTITVHIRRLREKLEDDPSHPKHIMTVKGLGYKLIAGETE